MIPGKDFIGVGVGAFIVSDDGRRVLLLRRKKPPEVGFWSIPGGAVEFGETFEEALKREVREETGLTIRILGLLSLTDHIMPEEGTHWVTPQLEARVEGGTLENLEPAKHDALEWHSLDLLPKELTMPTLNALRRYEEKGKDIL